MSTSTRSPSITVEGVRKVYGKGTVALDGVDLAIGPGLFGLLGPNGAGKSTLMRILCTLLEPSSGRATVCGYDVGKERSAVRARLGYLPQDFGGWRLQRVREVLDTLALLSGIKDRGTRRTRVLQVLRDVGLEHVSQRKVKKLSGGMRRRLGVAQALLHEPDVLVLDEPTVGLDPEERNRFRGVLEELSSERVILLSTHIVSDLGASCRDMALIDRGKIGFRGKPSELVERAKGRVFEVAVDANLEERVATGELEEVSRKTEGMVTRARVVHVGGASPVGRVVEDPSLEDAYLAFMAERSAGGVL